MVLGLDQEETKKLLMQAVIQGILWAVTFYFIRKSMNKNNFTGNVEEDAKKREAFKWDAIYGGFAASALVISKYFIKNALA